jgi:hypothetical protein
MKALTAMEGQSLVATKAIPYPRQPDAGPDQASSTMRDDLEENRRTRIRGLLRGSPRRRRIPGQQVAGGFAGEAG